MQTRIEKGTQRREIKMKNEKKRTWEKNGEWEKTKIMMECRKQKKKKEGEKRG